MKIENIIEQDLDKELLIYDLGVNKAYVLSETLKIVYRASDGQTTSEVLKKRYEFSDDLINLALDELKRKDLLDADSSISPLTEINRREAIRKVGLVSVSALPLIVGLNAPLAAQAASTGSCRTNVCYPAGFGLCNACPQTVNVTFFNSQNGSCTRQTITSNDNCFSGRYTVRDAKVNFIV